MFDDGVAVGHPGNVVGDGTGGVGPGAVLELGRQQAKAPVFQRLTRFVEHYPELLAVGGKRPAAVDMRYPNGFALRFAAASANEGKGKP